ncbi:MAG: Na+/H+ antiporter NhaA [Desulfofustis sp.]|nr:Na+/H+ antiporter NhaA [Desulfofustis sp.]
MKAEDKSQEYKPFQWFFSKEVSGSTLLLLAAFSAAILANSRYHELYGHLLHLHISFSFGTFHYSSSLQHFINDGLMALFFFTVGLEIKREILVGELATPKMALLPIVAAVGGMIIPGLIYVVFNYGTPGITGWGIPVATDIAFSLGVIAILGRNLPIGLRIFLSTFAIADDLGAVIIIAVFYTKSISINFLVAAIVCALILFVANLLYVRLIAFYVIMGVVTWACVLGSGVHATIAGVVVAMLVPARGKYDMVRFISVVRHIINKMHANREIDGQWFSIFIKPEHLNNVQELETACHDVATPLQRMEHALLPSVIFGILPLFAFFNAGLSFEDMPMTNAVLNPVTLGCFVGLLIGKPIGIGLASYLAVRLGIATLPINVKWNHIIGAGMLGGIGFTMSLFIGGLSFTDPYLLNCSKLGVFSGSILSALAGLAFLGLFVYRDRRIYDEALPPAN